MVLQISGIGQSYWLSVIIIGIENYFDTFPQCVSWGLDIDFKTHFLENCLIMCSVQELWPNMQMFCKKKKVVKSEMVISLDKNRQNAASVYYTRDGKTIEEMDAIEVTDNVFIEGLQLPESLLHWYFRKHFLKGVKVRY